jgi:head-tail adaptor
MVQNLCSDTVSVTRFVLTKDNAGGVTQNWRTVAVIPARLMAQTDIEEVVADGMQVGNRWMMACSAVADVRQQDRITFSSMKDKVFDVVGNNYQQTDLLIQHVALVERNIQ